MPRPLVLDEETLTPEQRPIFEAIRSGPRGIVEGPLRVWLQSPGLADKAQALGAYCRYGTSLPPRLSELAIITVGAWWRSGFEWHVHAPIAEKAGVAPAIVEAIRTGAAPPITAEDEAAVHAFSSELLENRAVSDGTYARTEAVLGTAGTVELVGILGYYTLICMTINAFHVPVPPGAPEPF
jgi:4-carboxymuconolactone decarboxylase